jgi:uncharacterized membrane protein SpoIIM required for sporulation
MIIDLQRFVEEERPYWAELERMLDKIESEAAYSLDLRQARRLHYLYERATSGLARITTFASEPDLVQYLEALVARAYGQIHEVRTRPHRLALIHWFFLAWPRTVRRHAWALALSVAITLAGSALGSGAVAYDPNAKSVIMPFPHLVIDPNERVREEEKKKSEDPVIGKAIGTSFYFRHNTTVALTTIALGFIWGIGSMLILFGNGVMMGAVTMDYVLAGQGVFLTAWLLPHGAVEIPAILLAGQAGIVLGHALLGRGESRLAVRARIRRIGPDLLTFVFGCAIMLAYAGFIEAFLSQYHEPEVPYWFKICLGALELAALAAFFAFAGRGGEAAAARPESREPR